MNVDGHEIQREGDTGEPSYPWHPCDQAEWRNYGPPGVEWPQWMETVREVLRYVYMGLFAMSSICLVIRLICVMNGGQ